MEKTIYTAAYAQLLELLRETRRNADVTQIELAKSLGQTQSFVSKIEVGDRRLDVIQLRTMCRALGTTLPAFIEALEQRIEAQGRSKRR
jgi:transcriptional regulator with XRE-family HTH domain